MNKNDCFIDLDFEIPLFVDDSIIERIKANNAQRGLIDVKDINPALTDWLNSKGMRPTMSEFFYKDPHDVQVIHTDGKPGDKGKLNWVFGQDQNSIMHWYKIKDINQEKEIGMGTYGPHALWEDNEIEYIGGWLIRGTPTLVNHGTPHRMINGGAKRLCISLIVRDRDDNQPTWSKWLEMIVDPPKRTSI
jgi:hypothetical protein